jgi:hypothetical protein
VANDDVATKGLCLQCSARLGAAVPYSLLLSLLATHVGVEGAFLRLLTKSMQ